MLELDHLPGLDDQQKALLRKAGFLTPTEILLPSIQDLGKRLRIPDVNEVQALIKAVSRDVLPPTKTAADMLDRDRDRWIGTGDGDIDGLLGGGMRRGCITEIAGESASGKSHLGLQLAVTSQLSPYSPSPGGTILLTSERKVSFSRLEELARHALSTARLLPSSSSTTLPIDAKAILDNIQTMHVTEVDGLEHALAYAVPAMISQISTKTEKEKLSRTGISASSRSLPVRLIVIDSIGALFRASFDSTMSGLSQRSKMLCLISDRLKALAEEYDLAVVVINQVSDVFNRGPGGGGMQRQQRGSSLMNGGGDAGEGDPIPIQNEPTMTYKVQSRYFSGQTDSLAKEASLGLVWANAVNVRLMLSRTGRRRALDHSDLTNKRKRIHAYDKEIQAEQKEERRIAIQLKGQEVQPLSQAGSVGSEESWESTLIRRMHLVFSPFASESILDYVILETGIRSLTAPRKTELVEANGGGGEGGNEEEEPDVFAGEDFVDDLGELPAEWWTGEAFKDARQDAVDRNNQRRVEDEQAAKQEDELVSENPDEIVGNPPDEGEQDPIEDS